jgi:hypothetical protein
MKAFTGHKKLIAGSKSITARLLSGKFYVKTCYIFYI